jgi:hypothetical protein
LLGGPALLAKHFIALGSLRELIEYWHASTWRATGSLAFSGIQRVL